MAKGYRASKVNPQNTVRGNQADETIIDLSEVKTSAEHYYGAHKNTILGIAGGLILIVGGYFAYKFLYSEPRNKEALEQMYQAEFLFEKDSFEMALNNPGAGFPGFKEISENYSGTDAGNLTKYYAAICNLKLGNYQEAKDFISSYKASGNIMPIMKEGITGDIQAEMNDFEGARDSYKKASKVVENDFLTPFYLKKLGLLSEKLGDNSTALEAYKEIKNKYPESPDGNNIEKFIIALEK